MTSLRALLARGPDPASHTRPLPHGGRPVIRLQDQVSRLSQVGHRGPLAKVPGAPEGQDPRGAGVPEAAVRGLLDGGLGARCGASWGGWSSFPTLLKAGPRSCWPQGGAGEAPHPQHQQQRLETDPDPANKMISSGTGKNPITEQIN